MTRREHQLGFDLLEEVPTTPGESAGTLSDEQRTVLAFEKDLVVSAGAGSGKTRTLVELYATLLREPERIGRESLRPSEVLCLTFTERAAREILARIREGAEEPDVLRELESAPIGTFHGWCANLLRDHPLEAGVDPRFTVLSEEGANDLLFGAAVETLRRGLEEGDAPARIAVEIQGFQRAASLMADMVREIRTAGWGEREPIERFEARLAEVAAELAGPLVDQVVRSGREIAETVRSTLSTPLSRTYLQDFEAALERWASQRTMESADALTEALKAPSRSWRGLTPQRHEVMEAIDAWRGAVLEIEHASQLGAWPALVVTVRAAYRAARAARGVLDYDDLLLRSRDLLRSHAETLGTLRDRYRVILVDEHQDTDPVQHEILELLLGTGGKGTDPRWCVVGDARQSIYGFRGATVEAFAALARDAETRGAHRTLAFNYRSRAELVSFHNSFFPQLLAAGPHAQTLAYVAQRAHRKERPGPAVEVLAPKDGDHPTVDAREEEARALAARIRAACDPADPDAVQVWDKETEEWRHARYGDVVILMRKLTQVEPYRRALQAIGIETVVTGSGEFYGRQEVFDVLNAIEAALDPLDAVALVAFLRSPMVGIADDAVWRLLRGWRPKDGPLEAHLTASAVAGAVEAEEAERLDRGRSVLAELRARMDQAPPGAVLTWLIDRTGYAAVLDAVPDHEQRRANLERLVALADRAPREGAGLLADWAAALRRRVENPPRDRDASPPEAGDRVVILSIHQAKGLEFPIVALADIGGAAQKGGGPGVVFSRSQGIVAKWWEDPAAQPLHTRSYTLASAERKENERAEETRLLYVAATRARDRLILSAGARTNDGWWLPTVLEFAQGDGAPHLELGSLASWASRHAGLSASARPAPGPGVHVLEPLPAAPGEATARALAAAAAGQGGTEEPLPPRARQSVRLRIRRGARAHAALERLPLRPADGFDVREWLAGMQVDPLDVDPIAVFVEREAWPRLAGAREVLREHPFRLMLPDPGGIVVGTIDCLWRDGEGAWWVWDYKLASDEEPDARHTEQLTIYALAAAAALGIDRVRGALWYLEGCTASEHSWDGTALKEAEKRLAGVFSAAPAPPTPPPPTGPWAWSAPAP